MTPFEPLNDDELGELDSWLGQNSEEIPSAEALDGFCTALAISPVASQFNTLLTEVLEHSKSAPSSEVRDLMYRQFQEVMFCLGPDAENEEINDWAPLFFELDEDVSEAELETGWGGDWAQGFRIAIECSPKIQLALGLVEGAPEYGPEEIDPAVYLSPMMALESGLEPDTDRPLTLAELRELEMPLIESIQALRLYFQEQ